MEGWNLIFASTLGIVLGVSFGIPLFFTKKIFLRIIGIVLTVYGFYGIRIWGSAYFSGQMKYPGVFTLFAGCLTVCGLWSCLNGYFLFRRKNKAVFLAIEILSWAINAISVSYVLFGFVISGGM
jgi:hypothetical protein